MVGGVLGFAGDALGHADVTTHVLAYAIAIAATIVMLFPGNGPLWDISLIRLGEVTLGTVCALLVCAVLSRIERWWCPAT